MIENIGSELMEKNSNTPMMTGEEQIEANRQREMEKEPQELPTETAEERQAEKDLAERQDEMKDKTRKLSRRYHKAGLDLESGIIEPEEVEMLTEPNLKTLEELQELGEVDYDFELKREKFCRDFRAKVAEKAKGERIEQAIAETEEITPQEKLDRMAGDDKKWDKFTKVYNRK